jgi:type 1 glutamine amidotransferase
LIISGRNNHDWRTTTPYLQKLLNGTGRFDVRLVEEPAGLSLAALLPYDLIVLDYCGPRWGQAAEFAVASAVKTGKGLVVVHGATYSFGTREVLTDKHQRTGIHEEPWDEYLAMTGGTWVEESGHGKRHIFEVKLKEHPITEGMAPSFEISDELYHKLKTVDGINTIGSAYSDPGTGGTGKVEPLLWTLDYGQGRVFQTALGHDVSAMMSDGFVTTFARGAEWAATGKVTLPTLMHAEPPKKDPLRVELVVGGHAFSPSLYEVFDRNPEFETNVVFQPSAYSLGQLNGTDVVVQYDMMQTITETQQNNLQRYLESGKGLVVLHHAVCSYQDWEWWWREVMGGHYVQKETPEMPKSGYQHDVWMKTETVAQHPVTRGVPPMLIYDEGYKNMWFSEGIEVLVKTDSPHADGPLAWVSPYDKARVVVIILGHGSEAHRHPDFQTLVHNAIKWTANRD